MGVSRVYVVGSPYNGVELDDLDFEQTADTMYLAHINHAVHKLVRNDHDDWEFIEVTFGPSIAAPTGCSAVATVPNTDADNSGDAYFPQPATYVVTALNDDSGQESRASNEDSATNDLTLKRNYNTITWSAVADADRYNIYKADNSQFYGYIGSTEDLTFTDDNIGPALDRAPPQAFSPFTTDNPSTVTFFEQRLILARTTEAPNAIWGSRSGQFENFDRSRPLRDDDSLSFSIVAGRVNAVEQLASTTSLIALTSDSIFNVDGDGAGGVLTASSQAARRQIGRGSSRLPPLVIDNVVFYSPSTGDSVRTIGYSFEFDGLKSSDVSIYSPHFLDGFDIVSWCYSQEPRSLIWAARSDGKLLCFTWEQEQNVWGWTLCETDGLVKSVCCITEGGEDRVYMIVERELEGVPRTFMERMVSHRWDDITETCFMDCAVSATFETARSEFSGLWHLEGRTDVVGIVDGVAVHGLTVADGSVTLPENVGTGLVVSFGIPYQVDVTTLPVRFNAQGEGFNVGRKQQTGQITLSLHESRSVFCGVDENNLYLVKSRTDEAWGTPDDLMTGDYLVDSANVVSGEASVHVRQTSPLPFTLLGVFMEPVVGS